MYKIQVSDGVKSVVIAVLESIEPAVKFALDLRGATSAIAKANKSIPVDVEVVFGDTVVLSFVRPASER